MLQIVELRGAVTYFSSSFLDRQIQCLLLLLEPEKQEGTVLQCKVISLLEVLREINRLQGHQSSEKVTDF